MRITIEVFMKILILVMLFFISIPTFANEQMIEVDETITRVKEKIQPVVIVQNEGGELVGLHKYGYDDDSSGISAMGIWAIRASYPEIFSVSIGAIIGDVECGVNEWSGGSLGSCFGSGFLVQFAPGVTGMKFSAGYATVIGTGHQSMSTTLIGFGVKATVLRTYGGQFQDFIKSGTYYLGAEIELDLILNLTLGVLRDISEEDGDQGWLFTGGIGFGF